MFDSKKKISHVSRVENPPKLRLYGLYLNERYMKTIGKQNILIIWLKESTKKQKNVAQKMLQGIIEDVQKKLRAMWRDGLYSVL